MNIKPEQTAINVLMTCGVTDPSDLLLEDLIIYYNGIVKETNLTNCDGRMVMKNGKAIVSVNSNIEYPAKKRFVLAHELGHMLLHYNKVATFSDDYLTLEAYKHGIQEIEANNFAAELLMPKQIFQDFCFKKKFTPLLLKELSDRFNTSMTSIVYRFADIGNHPICVFFSKNGNVQYWKKSTDFRYWIPDRNKLSVPSDSVANEYYKKGKTYSIQDSIESIYKSTWFDLGKYDNDTEMFEFCIITKTYNTVLSVIWEK